jgi:hypothetical protein
MGKYAVTIRETRVYEGTVEARSPREALEAAEAIVDPIADGFEWESTESYVSGVEEVGHDSHVS